MATFHLSWTCDNTVSTTGFKVRYRFSGTTPWTQFIVSASGDTAEVSGVDNRLYDFQLINLNIPLSNPASVVFQDIGINGLDPSFYPTNVSIGTEFENLSEDIDQYTLTIAETSAPGTIIDTTILYPTPSGDTLEYTFTGLEPVTSYLISITPVANQFYRTFTYTSVTTAFGDCAAPNNVTATLT